MLNGIIRNGMGRLFPFSNMLTRFQSSDPFPQRGSTHDKEALYQRIEKLEKMLQDKKEEPEAKECFPSVTERLAIDLILGGLVGAGIAAGISAVMGEESEDTNLQKTLKHSI